MTGYSAFAYFYDRLTANISYQERAGYFHGLIEKYRRVPGNILLDLACGTGSLTFPLGELGYDMIGVDCSQDMLSVAMEKQAELGTSHLFLCQDMTELDLYGTVDITVCALDSLNHLTDPSQVQRAMNKVSLFTVPGGLFLFDVNTPYKHREILGNNTFVYDCDQVFCVWQNSLAPETGTVTMDLDLFEREKNGTRYVRKGESFQERAYSRDEILGFLRNAGFCLEAVLGDDTLEPPTPTTQREIYVARKES